MRINRTNTILYCNRWEETVSFYRDGLQLQVLLEKAWFVEFQLSDHACLSVADAAHTSIESAKGKGITLSWQVDRIDTIHARLAADNIAVAPMKTTWGASSFFLFDPEGNRIELWS